MASSFITQVREFSDLDFNFFQNPISGDVTKKKNIESIKSSIKNLVTTSSFERPFQPNLGGNIYSLLFENYTPIVERTIEKLIIEVIQNYEPRAKITNVSVTMDDNNAAAITVEFVPVNTSIAVEFDILLERVR